MHSWICIYLISIKIICLTIEIGPFVSISLIKIYFYL